MTGPFADRLFRIVFAVAGIYNLAFGLWAAVWPLAFFNLFDIALPLYPGIWACLGMVVGLYGLLYWHAAWKLETALPIIAIGLLGKVLGPIGMAISFDIDWPRRLGMLCIYNDLIWWLPFGLFLIRGTAFDKGLVKLAPWLCIAAHVAAFAALPWLLQQGTLSETESAVRAAYIATHAASWSMGWAIWMVAAATLVGFYAWWGSRLVGHRIATLAVVIAAVGMVFDFSGEGLYILLLVELASTYFDNPLAFASIERAFTLLSACAANGLYTLAGLLLMSITPDLPVAIRSAMGLTWFAGLAMTVGGVLNHVGVMVVATVILFPLFIAWTLWMATFWRRL